MGFLNSSPIDWSCRKAYQDNRLQFTSMDYFEVSVFKGIIFEDRIRKIDIQELVGKIYLVI